MIFMFAINQQNFLNLTKKTLNNISTFAKIINFNEKNKYLTINSSIKNYNFNNNKATDCSVEIFIEKYYLEN